MRIYIDGDISRNDTINMKMEITLEGKNSIATRTI